MREIWQADDGELFCSVECAADLGHRKEDLHRIPSDDMDQGECPCGKELE